MQSHLARVAFDGIDKLHIWCSPGSEHSRCLTDGLAPHIAVGVLVKGRIEDAAVTLPVGGLGGKDVWTKGMQWH